MQYIGAGKLGGQCCHGQSCSYQPPSHLHSPHDHSHCHHHQHHGHHCLQTLSAISTEQSSTIVFPFPIDTLSLSMVSLVAMFMKNLAVFMKNLTMFMKNLTLAMFMKNLAMIMKNLTMFMKNLTMLGRTWRWSCWLWYGAGWVLPWTSKLSRILSMRRR